MRDLTRLVLAGVMFFGVGLAVQGCTTVRPYEREILAQQIMQFDANSEEAALERHFLETREGSSGGHGGAGGGCACN